MKTPAYRQRLAEAEAEGILRYLGIASAHTPAESELALQWVQESGIMLGSADGDLMLDQPVTRRQFAVMLYRYHLQAEP